MKLKGLSTKSVKRVARLIGGLSTGDQKLIDDYRSTYLEGCPFCRSLNVEESPIKPDVGDAEAFQDKECLDCEAQWTDEYSLRDVIIRSGPTVE